VKPVRALNAVWGPATCRTAAPKAEETDPGRWWVPEEVGRRLQWVGPQCLSCTAQGTRSSGTRQGQRRTRNPERTDVRERRWAKQNRSAITAIRQDLRENHRAGDREAHRRSSFRIRKTCRDIMEGSAPSETKEETAHRVRAINIGAVTTRNFCPLPIGKAGRL
jgi:hypothetical protein